MLVPLCPLASLHLAPCARLLLLLLLLLTLLEGPSLQGACGAPAPQQHLPLLPQCHLLLQHGIALLHLFNSLLLLLRLHLHGLYLCIFPPLLLFQLLYPLLVLLLHCLLQLLLLLICLHKQLCLRRQPRRPTCCCCCWRWLLHHLRALRHNYPRRQLHRCPTRPLHEIHRATSSPTLHHNRPRARLWPLWALQETRRELLASPWARI
jgi:hypothetical protein